MHVKVEKLPELVLDSSSESDLSDEGEDSNKIDTDNDEDEEVYKNTPIAFFNKRRYILTSAGDIIENPDSD